MNREKIVEIYGLASNGIIRPQLAANILSEVCETCLELFKIVEQQNLRLEKLKATQCQNHDSEQKTP